MSSPVDKIKYIAYGVLVVMPIYNDSPLCSVLGYYGRSPVAIVSLVGCLGYLFHYRESIREIRCGQFLARLLRLCCYLVVINIIAALIWLVVGGQAKILGENIVVKEIKGIIIAVSICAYLLVIENLSAGITRQLALKPFVTAFILLTIVAIVELATMPNAFTFLHYSQEAYWRPRLLSPESSTTSLQIIVYGGVTLYYGVTYLKKKHLFWILPSISLLGASTGSKSLMVSILVFAAIVIGSKFRYLKSKSKLAIGLTCCLIGIYLLITLTNYVISDFSKFTSIVSRSYSMVVGILLSVVFPFGMGNALYLHFYPQALRRLYHIIPSYLNRSEINSWINATSDYAISAKSGVVQYGLYWGVLGTIYFTHAVILAFKTIYKKFDSNPLILAILITTLLGIALWDQFDSQYCVFALLALADFEPLDEAA